ncbi:DUF1642 domain-containing protein [Streptococcus suis]|uniref:DUF1642 domain-containing protein n=1 Tax=Streptococcus suis TaxID=1307 RepID=UPI0038BB665F
MNKQEAIEQLEWNVVRTSDFDRAEDVVVFEKVKNIISQIHEPQKVVVPAFIDSYIRYAKTEGMSLFIAMDNAQNKESEWIITNEETFARAWLDGYEVEQEQLYTVEIPDPNSRYTYRFLSKNDRGVFIDGSCDDCWKDYNRNHLTESEIKQDFAWAWQWAEPVEDN